MQIFMSLCIKVTHLLQLNTADANVSFFPIFDGLPISERYENIRIKLKVWGHPENAIAVPGSVGMEECSLDCIIFKLRTDHLFFW